MKNLKLLLLIFVLGFVWGPVLLTIISVGQMLIVNEFILPPMIAAMISSMGAVAVIIARPPLKRNFKILFLSMALSFSLLLILSGLKPFNLALASSFTIQLASSLLYVVLLSLTLKSILNKIAFNDLSKYYLQLVFIRSMKKLGIIFFTLIVLVPFLIMIVTSLKSQQLLLANPLDFSLDFSGGLKALLGSYAKLFAEFNFGRFLLNSFFVSIVTVFITLFFSVPGAYVIARLNFPGREFFFHALLLIYMVPAIVLVIPLYAIFTQLGLRDNFLGLLIVYPATTIPVALYMLQGYFRNIPFELEEAGIVDGLTRIGVILKITIPLSLPSLVSVSLYVFMIAWNEFLFAFMFLDNVEIFTLSRGLVSLNSSEVPRQFLMAGAVVATIPVLLIFLVLERFLISGLTAGSVKG